MNPSVSPVKDAAENWSAPGTMTAAAWPSLKAATATVYGLIAAVPLSDAHLVEPSFATAGE
jgi:hypothetical protein